MLHAALDRWLKSLQGAPFAFRLWDGTVTRYGGGDPAFTVTIKDTKVLREMARQFSIGAGEAYMRGELEIEGSLEEALKTIYGRRMRPSGGTLVGLASVGLMMLRQKNRLGQSTKNIRHHYDVGNEFYNLWLGKERIYSCAYFKTSNDTIDVAQEQKLEHICRKLFLKPGETMLDIGCGWGGLVIHAAKKYGVKAHGITLSKEQYEGAMERIAVEGLRDRVTVEIADYRERAKRGTRYDKVASIGMFEHVGRDHLKEYMHATERLMNPGAIGLLHTIGKMRGTFVDPWVQKYIFPGGYLPAVGEITAAMNGLPFRITDIENLRLHYAMTLDRWHDAFEANLEKVRAMFPEDFVRMWRLYLVGSSVGFRYGDLELWQIQFTNGRRNDLPMTRDYLYE